MKNGTFPEIRPIRVVHPDIPAKIPVAGGETPASAALRYEALGRVMAALAGERELIETCRDLTWGRGADLSWNLEWREGPRADEVAELIAEQLHDAGTGEPLVEQEGCPGRATAEFLAMGIRFVLRAVDPVGRGETAARPTRWRLSEALDTTRSTPIRRPWEELFSG
ncbi:hypothetical protein SAMN05421505_10253 [Sinosporangium album]|uniref:Uncharacterized protein n=1 Tax=Sinosporangium album TaxID=504805 RepID=A0A1G7RXK3_9ACTN|nr:hypothetical protein [Sinosporangium album]SDG14530.1 hypothetical protein SAMN05421505_10253 [Sinosporangium album]